MNITHEQYLTFWRTLVTGLDAGRPIPDVLATTRSTVAKTDMEAVVQSLLDAMKQGRTLTEAMRDSNAFPAQAIEMVLAGESGGTLDLIARRYLEGVQCKFLVAPGLDLPPGQDPVRFWRALEAMVASGMPLLASLRLAGESVADPAFAAAVAGVGERIQKGSDLAGAFRAFPDAFPPPVCDAVAAGERAGELDVVLARIAAVIESGDLAKLSADEDPVVAKLQQAKDQPLVQRATNAILFEAIQRKASDIHVDLTEGGGGIVRLRMDGVLRPIERIALGGDAPEVDLTSPPDLVRGIVERIKQMAGMNTEERRLPQDGRILLKVNGQEVDVRVSIVPALFGERAVLRILVRRERIEFGLERIGLGGEDLQRVRELTHRPTGIVIVTGPVGSGKTTLLYSMLQELNTPEVCILTVEDPVEYAFERIAQIQVNPAAGLTFARAIRSMLRQDPDVIMVGEVRDGETAQISIHAALTGHLVLTTLHTNTASDALRRLLDIGIEPYLVASSVAGVVGQRLIRVLCPDCKRPASPDLALLPPDGRAYLAERTDAAFCGPVGCERCQNTGYRGRTAIHETLVMTPALQHAIVEGADNDTLRRIAREGGMKTMLESGLDKAASGVTSVDEVLRVLAGVMTG